jgi:hypothetical protein
MNDDLQIDLHRSMGLGALGVVRSHAVERPPLARNERDSANLHVPNREDRSSREAIPRETKKLQQMAAGYFSIDQVKQAGSCLE